MPEITKPHIMVVHNDVTLVESLVAYFSNHGYAVQAVNTGVQYLEKQQHGSIDAVMIATELCDIKGVDLAQQIQAWQPDLPIVLLGTPPPLAQNTQDHIYHDISAGQYDELAQTLISAWQYYQVSQQNTHLRQEIAHLQQQNMQLQHEIQRLNRQFSQTVSRQTEELAKTYQELKTLDQLKSEFLANISHELHSPMTPLEGYLGMFLEGDLGPLMPEQSEAMDMMQLCVQRLKKQIDNILYLVMLGKEQLLVLPESIFVPDLFANLEKGIGNELQEKQLSLQISMDEKQLQVEGDLLQVSRILHILVDNAIKFGSPNTTIQIHCNTLTGRTWTERRKHALEPHQLCYDYLPHELMPEALFLEISIQNRGKGITPEQLPWICNSFYQADGSSTRERGGVGLGLTIARKLLAAHHSMLYIESQPELGTIVSFLLPINQSLAASYKDGKEKYEQTESFI